MIRPGKLFLPFVILTVGTLLTALVIGNELIYRAALLWLLLFLMAFFWTRFCLYGISISRFTRESRVEFGQAVFETLTVTNNSRIPKTHIEIIDLSKRQLVNPTRVISSISGRSSQTFSVSFYASKRGYYKLGPTILKSGDLLGLFTKEIEVPANGSLLVTPIIIKSNLSSQGEGSRSIGNLHSKQKANESNSPVSIREYVPGDPLKKVHWLSTAKHNQYMVKEFELEPESSTFLILNGREERAIKELSLIASRDMLTEKKRKAIETDSTEYMACIAASVANQFICEKKNIGLFVNNAKLDFLPPDNELRQLNKILDILAFFEADSKESFTHYVYSILDTIPRGSNIYLITPFNEEGLSDLAQMIRAKAYRLHILNLFLDNDSAQFITDTGKFVKSGVQVTTIPMDGSLVTLQNNLQKL